MTPLIAGAYRPFGQPCCGTGERPASLGKADVSRPTCSALGGPARDCCRDPNTEGNRISNMGNLLSHIKSDLTGRRAASTVDSPDGAPHDTIDEWGVFASTTEALTLTILTELVRRAGEHPEVPSSVAAIVGGVYAAELDHWLFTSKHWEPST